MTTSDFFPGLPDPKTHAGFYKSIPSKRLFAWILDTILILLVSFLLVPFTAFTAVFFFPLMILIVGFIYRTATIAMGSATWGMRIANIELRDQKGDKFDTSLALLHTFGYSVCVAFPILQVISAIMILTTDRHQSLTDMVIGTAALNRKL